MFCKYLHKMALYIPQLKGILHLMQLLSVHLVYLQNKYFIKLTFCQRMDKTHSRQSPYSIFSNSVSNISIAYAES